MYCFGAPRRILPSRPTAGMLLVVILASPGKAEDPVRFARDIAPVLVANCLACHGPKKAEGSYRIDTFERLGKPGDTEAAPIVAGQPDESELWRRITTDDASERMPLEGDPLSDAQVAAVRRWIAEGAKYDAADPAAALPAIIPPPVHPPSPDVYPRTVPIAALAFAPDGTQIVAGGYHELTVWNATDGKLARRVGNLGERIYGLAFHPNGKTLAVACGAPGRLGECRIVDWESGRVVATWTTTTDVVLDVAFRPTGDWLAVAATDGTVRIYDASQGQLLRTLSSHSDWVTAVAWSQDGAQLASASRDKTAKVFDALSGELKATYAGHGVAVQGVAFHPDGGELYSAGGDQRIHRWKIDDRNKLGEAGLDGEVYKLCVSGELLFAASADKTARQFQRRDLQAVRVFSGHTDAVLSVACHEPTRRVATGGFDGEVRIWNLDDGSPVTTLVAAPGW